MDHVSIWFDQKYKKSYQQHLFPGNEDKRDKKTKLTKKEDLVFLIEYIFNHPNDIDSITFENKLTNLQGIGQMIKKPHDLDPNHEFKLLIYSDSAIDSEYSSLVELLDVFPKVNDNLIQQKLFQGYENQRDKKT